jgi:hydrogenase maturation protease
MLSSPIILYDYPRVAPESPGDLFDGGEIDQLLVLNVLALTDAEKEEMRATDPRARAILERTEALTAKDFMKLHGVIRELRTLGGEGEFPVLLETFDTPPPESIEVGGVQIRKGSKERLRPRPGADIMAVALAGKVAFVEAIEQDYDDRIHLAVTVEDDPGRALGEQRIMGHRFFFAPDEVEPIPDGGCRP